MSDAEVRDGLDTSRQRKLSPQHCGFDDADPPNPNALDTGGEPQVLHGATDAIS